MGLEEAREELRAKNDAIAQVILALSYDVERLKVDVKWIKKLMFFLFSFLLYLVLRTFL